MTHPFFIYPCQWSYITWLVGILLRATIAHDRDPSYIWRYALHADACWLPSDNRSRWRLTLRTTLFSYLLEYDLVEVIGFQMVIYNAWVRLQCIRRESSKNVMRLFRMSRRNGVACGSYRSKKATIFSAWLANYLYRLFYEHCSSVVLGMGNCVLRSVSFLSTPYVDYKDEKMSHFGWVSISSSFSNSPPRHMNELIFSYSVLC